MNEPFGPNALRLFAVAAQMLGWRPEEFWKATPAELASALASPTRDPGTPLGRPDLERMMETDNG